MFHITFDLELHDPIKKLDSKSKETYILEEESVLKKIFSLLNKYSIHISCFVTNEFVDVYKDFFHKYIMKNHEIGCHTANHLFYNGNNLSHFIKNIRENKVKLEREIGQRCRGFRAPGGVIPKNLIGFLKNIGFDYDSSVIPGIMIGRYNNSNSPKQPYYPSFDNIFLPNEKNKDFIEFPLLTSKYLKLSMNGIFFSIYHKFINLNDYKKRYGAIYFHPSDFKEFKFFDKSFFWDKIKSTKSYWNFLNDYIQIYNKSDLRFKTYL